MQSIVCYVLLINKKYIIYVTLRACYINKIYGIDQKFQQLNSHKKKKYHNHHRHHHIIKK